jgi:hypothetical protein
VFCAPNDGLGCVLTGELVTLVNNVGDDVPFLRVLCQIESELCERG